MEQDFKFLSEKFNHRYDYFFKQEENKTIENSLYSLGVLINSTHLKYKNIRPYNPKDFELINDWDIDIWNKVTWGSDDFERDIEENTALMDKALSEIPYFDYLVSNSVKYNRPTWAIFGLIGMMQGTLNQNAFEVQAHEVFTKEDFLRNINYLPEFFIQKNIERLIDLFRYFDERNFSLIFSEDKKIKIEQRE